MGGERRGGGDIPVSVLMTVYNAERYVGAAVSSVLN